MKRRRRIPIAPSKLPRPQGLILPRTPPLPSLLDYGDDDDEEIVSSSPSETSSPVTSSKALSKESSPTPFSPSVDVPPSPRLAHRQIPRPSSIPRRRSHEDDDNILESLLRQKGSTSSPKPSPHIPSIRLSEKRRRENDDDDEMLERLANKPKRTDLGTQKRDEPVGGRATAMKPGDDPPKRMKVMFRPLGMTAAQSTSPIPPDPGPKDGDTG